MTATDLLTFLGQNSKPCMQLRSYSLHKLLSNLIGVLCITLAKEKFCDTDNEWSVVLNPFDNHVLISVDVDLVRQMWRLHLGSVQAMSHVYQ